MVMSYQCLVHALCPDFVSHVDVIIATIIIMYYDL